jgi:hypothetical protein
MIDTSNTDKLLIARRWTIIKGIARDIGMDIERDVSKLSNQEKAAHAQMCSALEQLSKNTNIPESEFPAQILKIRYQNPFFLKQSDKIKF